MKNLLVIFGGVSSEHDVSCVSACSVIKNCPDDKYNILMMGITKDGEWYIYEGDSSKLPDDKWLDGPICKAVLSPDRKTHGIIVNRESGPETIYIDVIFPVLHGKNGEDGTIQGLFTIAGIPFVGCDMISSAMSMDKAVTNAMADYYNINQATWESLTETEFKKSEKDLDEISRKLGYPIFVKPANAGSSVGITKAHNKEELVSALNEAYKWDKKVVLEEYIDGFEVECAVLGNETPVTGVVGQITAANEFYDYDAKYNNKSSVLSIPALIPETVREQISKESVRIFLSLGCSGFSRVDFFVKKDNLDIYFNEINTIPGFTSISMYPKMMEKAGISYNELIDKLLAYAIQRGI